jgi:hypothetical protein
MQGGSITYVLGLLGPSTQQPDEAFNSLSELYRILSLRCARIPNNSNRHVLLLRKIRLQFQKPFEVLGRNRINISATVVVEEDFISSLVTDPVDLEAARQDCSIRLELPLFSEVQIHRLGRRGQPFLLGEGDVGEDISANRVDEVLVCGWWLRIVREWPCSQTKESK